MPEPWRSAERLAAVRWLLFTPGWGRALRCILEALLLCQLGSGQAPGDGGQSIVRPLRSFWSTVLMKYQQWGQGARQPRDLREALCQMVSTFSSLEADACGSGGNSHTLWILVRFRQAAGQVGDQRQEESEPAVLPLGSLTLGWVTTGRTCPWLKTTALDRRPSPDSSLHPNNCQSSFPIANITVVLGLMICFSPWGSAPPL